MAFSMGPSAMGGRSSRFRGGSQPLAEINIIPLVDVVLVLLIIFMLTAHVTEYGLEVDVPKTVEQKTTSQDLPIITITKDGNVFLNDKQANINTLGDDIKARFKNNDGVFVKADKVTNWDPIAQIVAELTRANLKIRMVTQPFDESGTGSRRGR